MDYIFDIIIIILLIICAGLLFILLKKNNTKDSEGLFSEVSKDVIRPSAEECVRNPRAKSTKMRWAIKA